MGSLLNQVLEGTIFGYTLVLARVLALMIWLPFFYHANIPKRVSVMFAVHFALMVCWGLGAPVVAVPARALGVAWLMAGEVALGMMLGVSVRLLIDGARSMGSLLSQAIGLAFATFIDPSMDGSAQVLERLSWLLMLVVMLVTGAHIEILATFFQGFELFAPGEVSLLVLDPMVVLSRSAQLFVIAVRLSAPALAVSFMVYASLAILSKVSPQVSLFAFGFALTIPGGIIAMWVSAPQTLLEMMTLADGASEAMRQVMSLLAQ